MKCIIKKSSFGPPFRVISTCCKPIATCFFFHIKLSKIVVLCAIYIYLLRAYTANKLSFILYPTSYKISCIPLLLEPRVKIPVHIFGVQLVVFFEIFAFLHKFFQFVCHATPLHNKDTQTWVINVQIIYFLLVLLQRLKCCYHSLDIYLLKLSHKIHSST